MTTPATAPIAAFDTNVFASGALATTPDAPPVLLIERWRIGTFTLITSEHILTELKRTLASPYFARRIPSVVAERLLNELRQCAQIVRDLPPVRGVATHPEDDTVLAMAVAGSAAYLVTGDRQLLALGSYQGVAIVTARAFLDMLDRR